MSADAPARERIGLLCAADQPVFAAVADRLRDAGYEVRFFDPQAALAPEQVDDVDLLVNKQVFPVALPGLRHAHRTGTPLWNHLTATVVFSSRLVSMCALDAVGCRTPPVTTEKPDGEYVAKSHYIWGDKPERNGDGDFYQAYVPTRPVDYKYYAVDDGTRVRVRGRRVSSKLYGPKRYLGPARVRQSVAACLRRFVERTGVRGVGVDFVEEAGTGRFWAVDLNLAAGYRDTGLEAALCASIRSSFPE